MKSVSLMVKICLCMVLMFPGQTVFAAKIIKEKVKTKFINLPDIPIDGLDASTIKAYLVLKDMKVLKKELATSTSDSVCNALLKKLGQKGPYTNHFYKILFSNPEPLLLLKTTDGKVIHAQSVPPGISPEDRFGTGCMPSKSSLDTALKKSNMTYNPAAFKSKMQKETLKDVKKSLQSLLVPEYSKTKFKLFSAKGAAYEDLNNALAMSLTAYKNMKKTPITVQDKASLENAIGLWEKALLETDLNNKNARINKKLAIDLNHNIAMNFMAIGDYQQAIEHFQKIKRIWGGAQYSGFSVDPDRYTKIAMERERRAKLSPNTAADTKGFLVRIAELKKASKAIPISILDSSSHNQALASVKATKQAESKASMQQQQNVQKAMASSNPFEGKVQHTAMQGYTLFLMPFVTPKYDAFPKEICELTHLNQIQLANNTLRSVPPEIGKLKNLKVLNLSSNQLTSLPAEIGQLQSLEKLNLAKNKLIELPSEIRQLKNLKYLNLKKNNISPEEIEKIKSWLPNCKIKK